MDLMLLRVFQRQVLYQCECALHSAEQVNAALQAQDIQGAFCGLQNLLNAAANISKALWGQKDQANVALVRTQLRESIGIADNSPLKDVRMRNHYEHFDERIDRWWTESHTRNIADMNLGPAQSIAGLAPIERFRSFDPASGQLEFWGESFDVRAVIQEIQRVLPKLREEAMKPHWDT
ncbi:MAG: hypothetical protein ACRD4U_04445 [Candidatus Acidiferrales bacterium]